MKKEIITPLDAPEAFREEAEAERQAKKAEQPSPLVRALGLAHSWQHLLDEGKFASLTEIAKAEGLDRAYVTRVFMLTRLAPAIVERAAKGDSGLTLDMLMRPGLADCWEKQQQALFTRN